MSEVTPMHVHRTIVFHGLADAEPSCLQAQPPPTVDLYRLIYLQIAVFVGLIFIVSVFVCSVRTKLPLLFRII